MDTNILEKTKFKRHAKWKDIKKTKPDLKLHMVGKLQSNKAKNASEIFEYIHSLIIRN